MRTSRSSGRISSPVPFRRSSLAHKKARQRRLSPVRYHQVADAPRRLFHLRSS